MRDDQGSINCLFFALVACLQFLAFLGGFFEHLFGFRENLPVLNQHLLPDDFPHDLRADAEQLGDGGVGVVEAVQQNLRYLSLLLPYQPERMEVWFKVKRLKEFLLLLLAFSSPLFFA